MRRAISIKLVDTLKNSSLYSRDSYRGLTTHIL